MIMLAITAQCLYTFGPALPTNFSKKGLILLSNLGPNPPSLIYFKFNKYILYSTYRQELQILLRLTYCIPCKHKITTFINILVINIHYDQGQSNFDGGYFFLSTHCMSLKIFSWYTWNANGALRNDNGKRSERKWNANTVLGYF